MRRVAWLGTSSILLIVAGLWLRSGTLIALAVVPLVHIALLVLYTGTVSAAIEAERILSNTRVMAGDHVEVSLRLRNKGREVPLMVVEDALPEDVEIASGSHRHLVHLREREECELRYVARLALRGRYLFSDIRATLWNPLSMQSSSAILEAQGAISAIPEVEPGRRLSIVPKRTRSWVGQISSKRMGQGGDFFSLRDYSVGDEMRRINWKASARSSTLITNEYVSEQSGDVTIVLDARSTAPIGNGSLLEAEVRAASTISAHVLAAKNRVSMLVLRDTLDMIPPAFGRRQFYRISERLIELRAGGDLPFDNIIWLVERYFPMESLIVVISPLTEQGMVSTILWLCSKGYDVVVLSPSPVAAAEHAGVLEDVPKRIAALERGNVIAEIARYARVIDWDPSSSLTAVLRGLGPRRGRG
ncbi:MAG: DUF58 domain-containing protein [Candidatus Thermoplasmatota archaeon]